MIPGSYCVTQTSVAMSLFKQKARQLSHEYAKHDCNANAPLYFAFANSTIKRFIWHILEYSTSYVSYIRTLLYSVQFTHGTNVL